MNGSCKGMSTAHIKSFDQHCKLALWKGYTSLQPPNLTHTKTISYCIGEDPIIDLICTIFIAGFSGGASAGESACQSRRQKRCRFDPWARKIPWRREWQSATVILPGKRSLVGYSPRVTKSQTWLSTHTCTHQHIFNVDTLVLFPSLILCPSFWVRYLIRNEYISCFKSVFLWLIFILLAF